MADDLLHGIKSSATTPPVASDQPSPDKPAPKVPN
jgi:hypothetical protein